MCQQLNLRQAYRAIVAERQAYCQCGSTFATYHVSHARKQNILRAIANVQATGFAITTCNYYDLATAWPMDNVTRQQDRALRQLYAIL